MRSVKHSMSSWPLRKAFVISRGARTEARVVQLMIEQQGKQGFAECVPYSRYNESIESVIAQIDSVSEDIRQGLSRIELQSVMSAGAARNAIDCALWDLEAKLTGTSVGNLTELGDPQSLTSAQTISIGSIEAMAEEAQQFSNYPILKVKLDAEIVLERIRAIHSHAPQAKIIIDANEAWTIDILNAHWSELKALGVMLIEQPLPAEDDMNLSHYVGDIPICADESFHTSVDIKQLKDRYQSINIKLDKTGGLTEAIRCLHLAREQGLQLMVGCMVGTSLAMAPATLVAQHADVIDLDGPALLAEDVAHGFQFRRGQMSALNQQLWGGAQ